MAGLRLAAGVMCMVWACAAHAQDTGAGQPDLGIDASKPELNTGASDPESDTGASEPELDTGASKPESDTSTSQLKFHAKFNAEAFLSLFDVREDSVFNPGNVLAQQPQRQFDTLLRAEFAADYQRLHAWVSPRVGVRWQWIDTIDGADTEFDDYGYVQDWGVRYVGDNLTASYGRELLYWGPGLFTSPSNPIYATVNPVNPFIEPPTRDIARVQYSPNDKVRVSLIANTGLGRDIPDSPEFENTYALKVDYLGHNYTVGAVGSVSDGEPQFGFVGQVTASDALLLYADVGYWWNNEGLYPQRDASPVGWSFVQSHKDDGFLDAVAGMSYTFTGGATLTVEYRYYGAGYDSTESDNYYQLARDSAAALLSGTPAAAQAAGLLGQATNPFLRGLNRNYIGTQLLFRDLLPNLSITLLSSTALDDGGSQLTGVANYYLSDRSRLAANVVLNLGGENTEFGRYIGNAVFIGYKYFF